MSTIKIKQLKEEESSRVVVEFVMFSTDPAQWQMLLPSGASPYAKKHV
jgi:hypothetical protein